MSRWFFAAFLLFSFSATAADEVAGGPYVVNVTGTSATVAWVLRAPQQRVGEAPGLRVERSSYSNLKPGMKISYDVLGGREQGKGWFKTAAPPGVSFRFVVFGDTRTRHEWHQKIVNAIVKVEPDFVVHTGDLVADGSDGAQWPVFFSIERELLRRTVFFSVLGNHERNNRRFYSFFNVTTPYYSFDWGSVHFALLDSDIGNVAAGSADRQSFWSEQQRWLEEDLAKAKSAEFRLVVMHHPPITAVKRRQGDDKLLQGLMAVFEKHEVTAVFSGHDHNYQRHLKNGVTYVVTGGGGAPLYDVDGPIPGITQKVERTEHFVSIKVEPGKVILDAEALDGHQIELVELRPYARSRSSN